MDADEVWRRPSNGAAPGRHVDRKPSAPPYTPPPRTQAPPPGLPPGPLYVPVAPPPQPPEQDHAALDEIDRRAKLVTIGVAVAGGVLTTLLLLVVVIRWASP
jgi:hypothetical protein